MLVQVNDCKNSWIWIIKHIFLINEKTLLNILDTFLCKIMKRKLKWISLNYVLPSYRTLDILEIGSLYNKHTQLNVCEKEEFQCFLYLIQIFGLNWIQTFNVIIIWDSFSQKENWLRNKCHFDSAYFCIWGRPRHEVLVFVTVNRLGQ